MQRTGMSQRYIRELCVEHCYAWIWTGDYNSHGGLSLYLHASANLDTYILNLHTQSRATVCTLHGNMYSSSMCAQLMFVSWYFQILLFFFEQVCFTKMAIKLAILRVQWWKWVQDEACNPGYILQFFSLKLELWFRSYDILNETRHILSKYSLAYALKTDTTAI